MFFVSKFFNTDKNEFEVIATRPNINKSSRRNAAAILNYINSFCPQEKRMVDGKDTLTMTLEHGDIDEFLQNKDINKAVSANFEGQVL